MDGGAPENFEGGGWWTTTMLWTIVLFGSFLLNATLLFAFLKRPGLRTISNRFVINLIASNLLTCLFLTPLLMLDGPPPSFGSSLCMISEGASALVVASSILSVLLIAIDQYFAVVDPLRYRTRIDKLKCGVLIISVWLVSVIVALLAGFNPHPQSLWLSCRGDKTGDRYSERNFSYAIDSTVVYGNGTEDYNVEGEVKVTERNGSSTIEEDLQFAENSTTFFGRTILESSDKSKVTVIEGTDLLGYITYGFAYATFYTIFVYLVPFIGVCWIYVSIYLAAHKNSERARRTGSGPMLSSPSFCEEYGINVRREFSNEDFRRIPKISSLSSIDESIETTSPSQIPFRRSEMMLCSSPIEEEPSNGVVFTVGSQKVDVSPQKPYKIDKSAKEKNIQKVPTSLLKAEFLCNKDTENSILDDNNIRSKFRDRPDDRRKSSHDIICENILRKNIEKFIIQDDYSEDSSADDEEMFTFTKNRRLEDIEVAKCQNSIEDRSEFNNIPLIEDTSNFSNNRSNDYINSNSNDEKSSSKVDSVGNPEDLKSHVNLTASSEIIINNTVQSSNKVTGNGILSRAALENHNAKSKLQNNRSAMNGRYLNGGYNRIDIGIDQQDQLEIFQKNSNGQNYLEAESSLLGTSAPVVTITPPHRIPLHRVSSIKSTSSYINSLKYRISNGSLFKYREETRAARISALVIVMGLICWTPYVGVLMIRNLPKNLMADYANDLPHSYDVMALSFLILAAYVSPLLFGYRSRRVKRELRKIFCFKKELSYKNNRSLMAKKVLKRRHSSNLSQIEMESKYNIFSCVYGRNKWPKEKVQFMQVPETALAVETCRSSFSSGASTQISTTSTEE